MTVKLKRRDFELLLDPVWARDEDGNITPTAFMLEWWSAAAQRFYGDPNRWIEVAHQLGYVSKAGDPIRFDYDPKELRQSLGMSEDAPLLVGNIGHDSWDRLWDTLFNINRVIE